MAGDNATYVIMVSGKNILLQEYSKRRFSRKLRRLGCFTTRVITAPDKNEACKLALVSVSEELTASGLLNDATDPPKFAIEKITEVSDGENVSAPRYGFTFYPE